MSTSTKEPQQGFEKRVATSPPHPHSTLAQATKLPDESQRFPRWQGRAFSNALPPPIRAQHCGWLLEGFIESGSPPTHAAPEGVISHSLKPLGKLNSPSFPLVLQPASTLLATVGRFSFLSQGRETQASQGNDCIVDSKKEKKIAKLCPAGAL